MKKLIIGAALAASILTTGAFAIDASVSDTYSLKKDSNRAVNEKDAEESRDSKSKRKSYTESKEESERKDIAVVKIEQTDILQGLEKLELEDIEAFKSGITKELGFFGSCSVISYPRLPADFGITAEFEYGIDSNMASLIDNYAKASSSIRKFVSTEEEKELREYMNCLLQYGVIGAQSLVNGEFTLDITDPSIKRLSKSGIRSLKRNRNCRFNKVSDSIQCGSLKVQLDYEPMLFDKQISYYSSDRYLGLSGTETYTVSDQTAKRDEDSKSSEVSISSSNTKDKSITYNTSESQANDSRTEVSARNFFSKLFK